VAPALAENPPPPISTSVKRQPPKPKRQSNGVVNLEQPGFLRLRDVLAILPVSRSSWYAGIKKGIYPTAVSMGGPRKVGWKTQDIKKLVDKLET
jgi:predicted DNA-binding transcriptional regulator AlpA